jgi:hypothetical protein
MSTKRRADVTRVRKSAAALALADEIAVLSVTSGGA